MALALEIAGVDRISSLEYDTLSIEQDITSYVATAEFQLVDDTGALSVASKASIYIYDGATTYFHGSVAGVSCENFTRNNLTARRFTVRCQDDHLELEKRVVDYATFADGEYSDLEIIDALFAAYYASGIDYATYPTGTPLDPAMEELTLEGVTLRQALSEICRRTGGQFYVHYASSTLYFHYFSSETNAAAFSLSDSYDDESSFGYEEIEEEVDATQLANAFYIVGKDVLDWETDADSIETYGRHEAPINDPSLLTADAVDDRGAALLARYKDPYTSYRVVTDHGAGLRAGMQITLVWSTRAIDASFNINRIRLYLRGNSLMYELQLGSVLPDFASGGRGGYDDDQRQGSRVVQIEEEVFDTVAPGTPSFEAGNLATGVHLELDGTQNVWITMTWGSVEDADLDHYEAQLSTSSDFTSEIYTRYEPGTGDRLCLWEFLQGNTVYYARVRSTDWAGNASAWAGTQNITSSQDSSAPDAPASVTATATPTSVHLSWPAVSAADLAGYDIQRKPDEGEYSTISTLHGGTLFIDNNVTPGQAYWYQVRATDTSGNGSAYVEIESAVTPAKVGSIDAALTLQGWSHNLVFSATDHDTVAWGAGTIALASGTTYNIQAGNTGNMAAVTYIYLNVAISTTVLQTTTTVGAAAGDNRILVAVAQNVAAGKKAIYQVFGGAGQGVLIVADNITAATITTNEIAANTIVAGNIAAGTITGTEIAATTITAANIQALTIGAGQLAANAVTADKILANAVTSVKINALAVTTAKLDAGAVTVEKLDVVVGGYNLLTNSGFNDDDDGDSVPDEWTEAGNITGHSNELDATTKVVGASCFHLQVTGADTSGDEYFIYQEITLAGVPLAVGDKFTLSGYIKADTLNNLRARIYIAWYDDVPVFISSNATAWVIADQGWTRAIVTGTVPGGAVTAYVYCNAYLSADAGSGHVRWDAIKLERGDVPTTWTTGMVGNVTIDSNRVQVVDSNAKVWLGKRGASLGMWGENADGDLQVGWYASGDNAGGILAGAGAVLLDANGIQVEVVAAAGNLTSYQFANDAGTIVSRFAGYYDNVGNVNGLRLEVLEIADYDSVAWIGADAPAGQDAQIYLSAYQDVNSYARMECLTNAAGASTVTIKLDGATQLEINTSDMQAAKSLLINDTANANQTLGITVNQGASDDEILSLKSSDISQLVTDVTEPDTYLFVKKLGATTGGAMISGFEDVEGSAIGLQLSGYTSTALNTAKTTAARGAVELRGYLADTGAINATADGNIVALRTYRGGAETTIIIFDEDGDIYFNGTTAEYDAYDDALMAGDLAHVMSGQYDKLIEHNREAFEAAGIIGPQDERGRFMVSTKRMTALTLGALGQLWEKCQRYERALARIDPTLLEEGAT